MSFDSSCQEESNDGRNIETAVYMLERNVFLMHVFEMPKNMFPCVFKHLEINFKM